MGAPVTGTKAADLPSAETLLTAFKTIDASERRRHASVLNYWLSIRGEKEFPPLHDLDPLELSDAGPQSILMELISGGHDAEIRHMGEALRDGGDWPERIMDADSPSVLSCIAKKLPIVAISRDFLAFEDEFDSGDGPAHCWVTLLPLSAGGAWVDYVYALVSVEAASSKAEKPARSRKAPEVEEFEEPVVEMGEEPVAAEPVPDEAVDLQENIIELNQSPEEAPSETSVVQEIDESADEPQAEGEGPATRSGKSGPGFSKLLDSLAGLTGFYGSQPVQVEPVMPVTDETEAAAESVGDEPTEEEAVPEEAVAEKVEEAEPELVAEEETVLEKPAKKEQPTRASEGTLQDKLTDVRAKADEARMAKLRANAALYEGLGAAYDFALDAEEAPEEYLRLVEAQGLKIQLRSPMKPVVKLAFDGLCDDATIKQLEAVLAWAFDEELPRGTLAERIEAAGGIAPILNGEAKAA
ncbi:MAG: hypothetical protein ACJ8E0_11735 [Sphingomicrobium sp.]